MPDDVQNVFYLKEGSDSDNDIIIGMLTVVNSSWNLAVNNIPDITNFDNLAVVKATIESQIKNLTLQIENNNNYISSLPTVRPVPPPSLFEEFCDNMSDFIDASVGTLVDITARGLSTVLEGAGQAIGNMFNLGGLPLVIGAVIIGVLCIKLVPRSNTNKQVNDNQPANG